MSRITTPFSFHSTASEIIEGIDLTGKAIPPTANRRSAWRGRECEFLVEKRGLRCSASITGLNPIGLWTFESSWPDDFIRLL
jgi:hypothetical protein